MTFNFTNMLALIACLIVPLGFIASIRPSNRITPLTASTPNAIQNQNIAKFEQLNAKATATAKKQEFAKFRAEQLAIDKERAVVEAEEKRVKKILKEELPYYTKLGKDWRNYLIKPNHTKSQLAALARFLWKDDSDSHYHFWTDKTYFNTYKDWDENYPNYEAPPEWWIDESLAGSIYKDPSTGKPAMMDGQGNVLFYL